jgi:hypothetical protein
VYVVGFRGAEPAQPAGESTLGALARVALLPGYNALFITDAMELEDDWGGDMGVFDNDAVTIKVTISNATTPSSTNAANNVGHSGERSPLLPPPPPAFVEPTTTTTTNATSWNIPLNSSDNDSVPARPVGMEDVTLERWTRFWVKTKVLLKASDHQCNMARCVSVAAMLLATGIIAGLIGDNDESIRYQLKALLGILLNLLFLAIWYWLDFYGWPRYYAKSLHGRIAKLYNEPDCSFGDYLLSMHYSGMSVYPNPLKMRTEHTLQFVARRPVRENA